MKDAGQRSKQIEEQSEFMVNARSMLVISVGDLQTHALLFDSVENQYRLLGKASAPTTAHAPTQNVMAGIRACLKQLESVVGRALLGGNGELIHPLAPDGSGVGGAAATVSAGPPLKIVTAGLLEDVSVTSAQNLARATYCGETVTISLSTIQDQASQIDAILRLSPDLVIVAGGTDHGAAQSVFSVFETVHMACQFIRETERPPVLFAGNQALNGEIEKRFGASLDIQFAPNVRPSLDAEDLVVAQERIGVITKQIRLNQISGLKELDEWADSGLMPSAAAFGNIIQFLSSARSKTKGVMGIDISDSGTTLATAYNGNLSLRVFPELGLCSDPTSLLEPESLDRVTQWLSMDIPIEYVQSYLLNKSIYPTNIPITGEDLAIEHALVRHLIRSAVIQNRGALSPDIPSTGEVHLPWVEPILASGGVLARAPSLAHSLLMLLDGLQPTGATTFVLDPYGTAAALGAAARVNPTLTVQVLDSNAFMHLGTVISLVGEAKPGTPILRAELIDEADYEIRVEIKSGTIDWLPLAAGRTAMLKLHPLQKHDVGMGGPGIGGTLLVKGGALGVVIDGRGRPLTLPSEAEERYETFHRWLWALRD